MKKQLLKTTMIAAAGFLFANSTMADTVTTDFEVTATVADSCLVSATDLNFGAYDSVAATALDGTSTITVTCTAQTPYTIGLDAGQHFATTRAMIGDDTATTLLKYELYTESGHGTIWGELLSGTTVANSSLAGGALDYTVYGQIPASQYVPAANYVDTINVTVDY